MHIQWIILYHHNWISPCSLRSCNHCTYSNVYNNIHRRWHTFIWNSTFHVILRAFCFCMCVCVCVCLCLFVCLYVWMCICVCVCVWCNGLCNRFPKKKKKKKKKKELSLAKKTATGSCVVQDQALQQWWSIRSALQRDWWCNSSTKHYASA